jgi:hypothetical protein
LPKWKKDAKEFTVSVNFNKDRGYQSSIPKPIIDALGEPERVTFVIDGKEVKITSKGKFIPKKSVSWKKKKELT